MSNKTQAHPKYLLEDGSRVVGVTTVLSVMAKPALKFWANKLGLDGISISKYVDNLADIGTLCHKMVENYINNVETDFSDYSPNQRDKADNAFIKFLEWEKENEFTPIDSELRLVSEKYKFGGTCDIYAKLNGKLTLIDLKTSKACYSEQHTQVAAYSHLLQENGKEVEDVRILRIGRDETEGFEDIKIQAIDLHWRRFKHCLALYEINKRLKRCDS